MGKNVMIPLSLLHQIVGLLEYCDVSNYDAAIQLDHYDVLRRLNWKKHRLRLHDDHAKVFYDGNRDDRDGARARYFQYMSLLRGDEDEIPF